MGFATFCLFDGRAVGAMTLPSLNKLLFGVGLDLWESFVGDFGERSALGNYSFYY